RRAWRLAPTKSDDAVNWLAVHRRDVSTEHVERMGTHRCPINTEGWTLLERVLRGSLEAVQVPLEPVLGFAKRVDVFDSEIGVRNTARIAQKSPDVGTPAHSSPQPPARAAELLLFL